MSLEAHCATCATRLALPSGTPGQRLQCGQCGAVNVVTSTAGGGITLTVDASGAPPMPQQGGKAGMQFGSAQAFQSAPPQGQGFAPPPPSASEGTMPPSYLALAIVGLVLGCLPLAIVALIYSTKVERTWLSGDHELAERYSRDARNWSIAAFAIYLIFFVLFALALMFGAVASV